MLSYRDAPDLTGYLSGVSRDAVATNGGGTLSRMADAARRYGYSPPNHVGSATVKAPAPQAVAPHPLATPAPTPAPAPAPQTYAERQMEQLRGTPGYQFRFDEGLRAIEQSAAARGGLHSGKFVRGATRYGQDYATGEFNTRFNQLQALQGGGQAAANSAQNSGQAYSGAVSNAAYATGQANALRAQQQGSIYGNLLGTAGGLIQGVMGA